MSDPSRWGAWTPCPHMVICANCSIQVWVSNAQWSARPRTAPPSSVLMYLGCDTAHCRALSKSRDPAACLALPAAIHGHQTAPSGPCFTKFSCLLREQPRFSDK